MEKTRRRNWRKSILGLSAIIFAASFAISLVPSIRAIAEGAIFKIKSAEITQLSSGVDGAISSHDDSTIVSDVTFHKLGDTATYKVVLQNTDSKDHVVETISDDNANSHISYSYDKHANETIAAGANLDFVFEAKYVKTPNTNERQQVSKVKFSIRFTDIDEPEEVIVAPNTYDGLGASFVVLAISSLGLIVCAAFYIKNHKKAAKVLTVALVAALATAAITSVKAATVEVNSFTLTTNYGFYDKVVVTYTDKNGDEQELISNYNEPANIPEQNKDGYTLTGWEDEQGNPVDPTQPITEDVKIHPIYRANTYTIKFNGNGANGEMTDIAMTYDETKTLPTNAFDFPGRTYAGWDTEANGSGIHYDDQAEVKNLTTEDNGIVTLYAQWSINPFHIDYDGNGATSGEMATTNCEYDGECVLRENAFEKTGYHFIGWKYSNNDYADKADVKNIIESGTITMVAQWEVNHYTIVFNINTDDSNASGDMADMANLEYGQDYTLTANAFTRTGYNFGGWNTEIDGRNFGLTDEQEFHNLTTTDNAVITLYAQWSPIHYTIVFHENSDGVTGDMANQVFAYDEEKQLTQNAFVKDHYKFMGWTTVANGTGTKYDDRASIFNLTTEDGATIDLYAQWKERTAYLKGTVNNSWGSAGDMIRSLPGYANATAFRHYEGEPNFDEIETKYNMAINSSNFPVYTWIDGETIYWWSEAETIYAHEDSRNFFSGLKKAETIEYSAFDFSLTKNIQGFFRNTAALSTIDLSPLATANPTTLAEMFYGSGITSVNLSPLSTENVTTMKDMFNSANKLTSVDLSAINTANVEDMSGLFMSCTNFESVDFSHNNLSSLQNTSNMFRGDKKLTGIDFTGVNTPNLENMEWMFGGAKIASLDLSDLDTGNVTVFGEMFYGANIENLDISGWDTSSATHLGSMFTGFNGHGQVLDLSHFDTSNVSRSMYEMFNGTNVSVIDLSSFNIDAERAANIGMENLFYLSNTTETIYATENLHFNPNANLNVPADYGGQSKLVGGAGSTLAKLTLLGIATNDKARIDDPCNGKPGMFAVKNAQYICYNANIPSDETGAGAQAGEYLSVGTNHLKDDAFARQGYAFLGWATSANGDVVYASGDEITIVEESKTPLELYAQWEPATFTISFNSNIDGATGTMGDQTVTHGTQTPLSANAFKKDHWRFLGWTTSAEANVVSDESQHVDYADQADVSNLTEDLDLHAKWLFRCRTFETDSWATIVENLENDPNYYDATDVCEKEIQMDLDNDSVKETYGLRLINTSTPEECSTPGFSQTACGTVIEFTNYVGIWQWNSVNSTNGGWANATLATRLNGEDLYGKMPEELRSLIIPTYPIVSGANQNGVSPDITASDTNKNKIYLHTGKELGVPKSAFDDKEDLTRTYDFYGVSEHKPYLNRAGGGQWSYDWWLRSALLSRDNIPLGIKSDVSSMISATPGANGGVATYPAFRIGRKFTVSFNAGEGAASETAREYAVSAMNYSTLPTITTAPEGKIFAGWYTAAEGGDRVNDNDTFVSSNAHTLYAHWITPTFYNITEMQQMTANICATATTPNTNASQFDTTGENVGNKSYIPRRELIDNRDGKSYQVTKLADGKCWMTENLALGDPDSTMTLTPNDSDVSSNFTLPKSDISAFAGNSDVSAVYVDDTFGGYYSVKTANLDFTEYGKSICPKGWRLPSAYSSGDWDTLERGYGIENGTSGISALYNEPFNYAHSFYVSNRRISNDYETVYIGPATDGSSFSNFGVYMPDNYTGTTGIRGSEGGSIRCVAR